MFWYQSSLKSLLDIPILINNISQTTVSSAYVPTTEVFQISDLTQHSSYILIAGIVVIIILILLMMIIFIGIFACVVKRRTPTQVFANPHTNMKAHPSPITETSMDADIHLSPIMQKPNSVPAKINDIYLQIDSHDNEMVRPMGQGAIPTAEESKQLC